MHRAITIGFATLTLAMVSAVAGCVPGQLLGPTITPTFTPTPLPTATPIPTNTATPLPDSRSPFKVGAAVLKVSFVNFAKDINQLPFYPEGTTAEQGVIWVQFTVISGATSNDVLSMAVWITDETGTVYNHTASLTAKGEPVWLIAVPKNPQRLVLHFPSGEVADLTSWLH